MMHASDALGAIRITQLEEKLARVQALADDGWHEDEAGAWVVYVWKLQAALAEDQCDHKWVPFNPPAEGLWCQECGRAHEDNP